jgi:DNA polymerase III epsilon subunit-like protein
MDYSACNLLNTLLQLAPRRTAEAPADARGLYSLIDHQGQFRYIGSTSSADQSLYERIHQRHRTGSEGMSHYLSDIYNTGRMWRDRKDASTAVDGKLAKRLRNCFIADYCRAVWLVLPDHVDIAALEREVLAIAPPEAIAWNGRAMPSYEEPFDLVDRTIARLGWGEREIAAIERQRQRHLSIGRPAVAAVVAAAPPVAAALNGLPKGEVRFFALDVETANCDRGSICQVGIAGVRPDNSVMTWSSYVDPQTDSWACSGIHGITAETVRGAPTFAQLLPKLEQLLAGRIVFQHSSFDSTAIAAASRQAGLAAPEWVWRDSVRVARCAWPELKDNGGHGLASLRHHLRLKFKHHDAGEDARASAEVVLRAERLLGAGVFESNPAKIRSFRRESLLNVDGPSPKEWTRPFDVTPASEEGFVYRLGQTEITAGNIANNHIYLRGFFERFPAEAIGGSNKANAAACEIVIEWGGTERVVTDLDGKKKFFRKRSWIRDFFATHDVVVGTVVFVDQIGPLRYRLTVAER